MYFRLPLRDLIAEDGRQHSERPIRRIGDNCFIANGCGVIIRYASKSELRRLRATKLHSCAYLIDDDLHALRENHSLPEGYRRRLLRFQRKVLPAILELSDTVIAPNQAILRHYGSKRRLLLHPAPVHVCKDFSHFRGGGSIRIVFAGTRSHLQDLEFIVPVMEEICRRHPTVQFITFLGKHAPAVLRRSSNVHNLPPLPWASFRELMRSERFHIGIAPFLDTPFNRARSITKVLDHAAFGAAGVYSTGFKPCEMVRHGENGLCVANAREAWLATLEGLISAFPDKPSSLADQAARALCERAITRENRTFWHKLLMLS